MSRDKELTEKFSTWGDKLLQHTDVLYMLQHEKRLKPVTIQVGLTEQCESDCPFCSVAARPLKSVMPWEKVVTCLESFELLGAKSVELTGSGNPLLFRNNGKDINDVIELAHKLEYDIGIITNSHDLKVIKPENYEKINWIRISLIKLDEGFEPEDYNFRDFPTEKLGFSYIIYDSTGDKPDEFSRTKKPYKGTSEESINKIAKLVEINPSIKFVRIAGNCLIKGNNEAIKDKWKPIIDAVDKNSKFFIKEIGLDDDPYNEGCYVGGIRPYIAAHPNGGDYQVYTCTSHVLNKRTYDLDYSLGNVDDILIIWYRMAENLKSKGYPYEVKGNQGKNWCESCKYCYYKFNNKLLHTVNSKMPDSNFA